jgi:signal transduction histidine kinase/CheY-like chemotaxis protein/HPt (histidine-containing phosphotransfer) domain-containing protein
MTNYNNKTKKIGIKNVITAGLVIIFFVALIVTFYVLMYASVKENISLKGEEMAVKSAEKFDRYLITSTNLVKLEKNYLDEMLEKNASQDEIQQYMEAETRRIQKSIDENYTGLYGYILDEYHDGSNWVPDEDYVPTHRPWYIEAIENKDEITIIQPYLDAQTNSIITTLAITLADGKSVLALDISFDMIQTVTEENHLNAKKPIQIILDDEGCVVAHSFAVEIGNNYREEKDTMGSMIVERLYDGGEHNFEIKYDGVKYMVYAIPINNGWFSLSVVDTTERYRPLNIMLVVILLILVLAVVILYFVFANSRKQSIIAERLNHQLATTADIYMAMYDIDIINDTYEVIKTIDEASTYLSEIKSNAQQRFINKYQEITDKASYDSLLEFIDLSTLNDRLSAMDTITTEFKNRWGIWCRGRFLVSERTEDGNISHVLWFIENIDAEKRSKERLINMSERAVAANEAKSAFLSNMSHEIRTPINAMLGLNEMILREGENEDILSYASGIDTAGHTLLGIVNDILDFSKIEAGKMEIIPVDYSLASMLNDLVNMVHTRADEKGLVINVKVNDNIPDGLHGDEIRVKQVITNILTNAVKYTEKGSVTFAVDFEKSSNNENEILLRVSISDTGIGIKKEDMSKLFSEFDRIEEKRNRNIEGTGLGMAITKSLLTMMGSTLKVESEYGKGSVFSFSVAQQVVEWKEIGNYESRYRESIQTKSKYKERFIAPDADVLVVDDTPLNLTVFSSLLKKTKMRIDTAPGGNEAIHMACSKKYDIIFLDHMMPEKDGIETLQELREMNENLNKNTPFICLTANAISGEREKYLAAGFDDYLTKPIDSQRLEEMLMKYLPDDKIMEPDANESGEDDEETVPNFVYELGVIDVDTAVSHCGSVSMYNEILQAFVGVIGDCVNEAKQYWNDSDMDGTAIKVHAIKSQLRTIGAYSIGDLAETLETAAKERDVVTLEANLDDLFEKCAKLEEGFAPFKNTGITNDESLPDMTEEQIKDIYSQIAESVEEYDIDKVEELIEEFKKYHIPEAHLEEVNELYKAVDNVDYDRIPEIIGR